nr:reverse transcriptase domain-containing protein [Tanacetum cinerariifolium]
MADRTMEELLQAPTEGYGEDIIILEILAKNFEIKTNLLHNQPSVCAATGSYNQASPPNRASHQIPQLGFTPVQNNPISFADALLLMPKFALTNKSLLTNKDKLFKLAKVPLSENCSAMLLKKLPEKVRDSGKFLIPFDFPGMEVCHALADLGASINLMPLSIWKKLSLLELTPTRMNLELADRSITRPKGVVEDVFIKVGKFHFPTNFVVVDFEADPRVPLILGRSFLKTGRALIDVYGEEITLRVNNESVTFNLNQTMRYSLTYDDNFVNRVDVIDIACEKFVQDVLDFQYTPKSSNPTLVSDPIILENDFCKEPIVKSSSPTHTSFGESDFFLEEIKDFLNDDLISTGIQSSVYDPEGDILFLEKFLNEDPFLLPPMDLKHVEETKAKSSNKEPTELELKELLSHLEYAFLEESDKLPVIIAKDLKYVEKEALIKVLKSHKQAIAWKISDIKGIDLRFYTHKILMDEDYKPTVQSQRRVNPKIHDVIKKEVIKLLDADMIYPISDSPEGIVLGHKILMSGIEVDRAKVDVIANLPHPTTIKGVRSFLGHAGFYRHFIQDFSKFARPMTHLLENETPFVFSKECVDAFNTLKKKLTEAPILVVPDWNLPFELMCDAGDFTIGAVLGQRKTKHFQPIHFASKTMTEAQIHYTKTEKEMLAKLLISSKLSMRDLLGAIMVPISQRRSLPSLNEWSSRGFQSWIETYFREDGWGKLCLVIQLNELSELRDQPYENSVIYKERTKKFHDSKIKNRIFNVGDQVLLFNSLLKIFSGKLKTRWSGPFTIT